VTAAPALAIEALARTNGSGPGAFVLEVEHFCLRAGEAVAVAGPSGSGKSTLLDLAALAVAPDHAGVLSVAGEDAAALWRSGDAEALARLRARGIGYVLQTGALLPFITVRANIALPQRLSGRGDLAHVEALADTLGIADVLDRKPAALSVGQRQRAAIARALSHRPALVLADEPTASVHPEMADTVLALLIGQTEAHGAALLLATHDPERALRFGLPVVPVTPVHGESRSILRHG
jgi:putative ABC transport system ATP-binding protein